MRAVKTLIWCLFQGKFSYSVSWLSADFPGWCNLIGGWWRPLEGVCVICWSNSPIPPLAGLSLDLHLFCSAFHSLVGQLIQGNCLIPFSRPAHDTASAWFNFISWRKAGVGPSSYCQSALEQWGQGKWPKTLWYMICSYISAGPLMVVMSEYEGGASSALADPPCDWRNCKSYRER